jgi:hypothetical protein
MVLPLVLPLVRLQVQLQVQLSWFLLLMNKLTQTTKQQKQEI